MATARRLIAGWRTKADALAEDGRFDGAKQMRLCADQLESCINAAPVRVLRVMEYVGPRDWVERTLAKNAVTGTREFSADKHIKSAIVGEFPEIMIEDEVA